MENKRGRFGILFQTDGHQGVQHAEPRRDHHGRGRGVLRRRRGGHLPLEGLSLRGRRPVRGQAQGRHEAAHRRRAHRRRVADLLR